MNAPGTGTTDLNLVQAVNRALREELARDPSVRVMGYDIGPIGGVFRATEGLYDAFGGERVIDTPLSENGLIGAAVGMAMRGERPVVEIQFLGFLYNAFGQFVCLMSNVRERSGGQFSVPMTIRTPFGGGIKPLQFHSESTESYLIHTPGLRVVCPSTPADAKGLLAASIRCDDPVVFLEHSRLYRSFREPVPNESYLVSMDEARVVRPGRDVTVLAWGAMVHVAREAIDDMAVDAELIDLRVLAPLDVRTILDSVRRTGRCVIVQEARRTLGLGAELSALINEHVFDCLKAPVRRVTAFDVQFPENQTEDFYLPDAKRVRHGIESVMHYQF
nr:F108 [uncultured bacterium]